MPITTTQNETINHYPGANAKLKSEATELIEELDYAKLWRGPCQLAKSEKVRIDIQGTAMQGTYQNIQIQRNGSQEHSTIAHVLLAHSLGTDDAPRAAAVLGAVQAAFRNSLAEGKTYTVAGTLP